MKGHRWLLVAAVVAVLATVAGLAALASGGATPYGVLGAGERQMFVGAAAVAFLAGVALLVGTRGQQSGSEALGVALAGLLAASAFSLPAVWAFATPLEDGHDSATSSCGTISDPATFFDQVERETRVSPACAGLLRKQKAMTALLAAPSVLVAVLATARGVRGTARPSFTAGDRPSVRAR